MEEIKLESALPQLLELECSLEDGIDNCTKLIEQYKLLIDIVNSAKKEKKEKIPKDFINGITKECESLEVRKADAEERLTYVRILLDDVQAEGEKAEEVLRIASLIYASLGILNCQQEKYAEEAMKTNE